MTPPPRGDFYGVLDQLRAFAAVAVVFSHFVGNFLDYRSSAWVPNEYVVRFVESPLGIVGHFGWIGVAVFFLISGVVITHAATRETGAEFIVRRLMRIYPPVIATVVLVMVLAGLGVLSVGLMERPTIGEGALAASLANWLVPEQPTALLAVGWTLVIEMFFYLAVLVARPLLAPLPGAVPAVVLALSLGVSWLPIGAAAHYAAYLPVLVLGQVLYLVAAKRIGVLSGAAFMAVAWVIAVAAAERLGTPLAEPGALANVALAVLVVVVAMLLEGRVRPNRVIAAVSRRSYSLYLVHVPVGFSVALALDLYTETPYTVSLLAAIATTAVATEVMYRLVERPSRTLGARLGRRIRRASTV